MGDYQHIISEFKLVNGSKGAYEFVVNGDKLYSKHENGRHAEEGELYSIFAELVGPDVTKYGE